MHNAGYTCTYMCRHSHVYLQPAQVKGGEGAIANCLGAMLSANAPLPKPKASIHSKTGKGRSAMHYACGSRHELKKVCTVTP